jgi:hypothetical protein
MYMTGQFHNMVALFTGKLAPEPTAYQVGWSAERVRAFGEKKTEIFLPCWE